MADIDEADIQNRIRERAFQIWLPSRVVPIICTNQHDDD